MGGKEGAWGYLAQAVVSVIFSLVENDWDFVQIEPDTNNDKVDIAWYFNDRGPEVVQVKTSKRNFPLPDIRNWLETLIDDVKDADEYELILLGTCNNDTKDAINRINENRATDDDWNNNSFLKSYVDKITVTLKHNDHDALDSQIYRHLGKYLSSKGKQPNDKELDLMSKALGYTYMLLSTQGKKESKEDFEKRLLDWVDSFLGETEARKSELRIEFYLRERIPFSSTMRFFSTDLIKSFHVDERKKELIHLYNEIHRIKIDKKERVEPLPILLGGINIGAFSTTTYCEIAGKRREVIEALADKHLDIKLNDDFFYIGNLTEPTIKLRTMFGTAPVERTGTDEEKLKYQLHLKFENILEKMKSTINMFSFMDSFMILPLVLRNTGTKHDKQIKVKIYLPDDVKLLDQNAFQLPDLDIIKEFTGFNKLISMYYSHRKDSQINPYPHESYDLFRIPSAQLNDNGDYLVEEFRRYLRFLFDYEIYKEQNGHVLLFHFNQLSPKENLAFPCFLLVRASKTFELKYEVTSVNLPEIVKGTLVYGV